MVVHNERNGRTGAFVGVARNVQKRKAVFCTMLMVLLAMLCSMIAMTQSAVAAPTDTNAVAVTAESVGDGQYRLKIANTTETGIVTTVGTTTVSETIAVDEKFLRVQRPDCGYARSRT